MIYPANQANLEPAVLSTILMISSPGRRRDTLIAILRTMPGSPEILCAENLREARKPIAAQKARLVIIDHYVEQDKLRNLIGKIRKMDEQVWILLLVGHPQDAYIFENARPNAILCDGFSSASLMEEVQKARPFSLVCHPQVDRKIKGRHETFT